MHSPEIATPVWRIATLFPYQGAWSEQEYLALETNRRVEFDNGFVEVHDVPTDQHQAIILYLSIALNRFALQIGGVVRTAGLRLRLWDRKYREPDIVFLHDRDSSLRQENFWDGADLAIEIVSQSLEDRERDLVTKADRVCASGHPGVLDCGSRAGNSHGSVLIRRRLLRKRSLRTRRCRCIFPLT